MLLKGFPNVIALGQQYNFRGKPTVILYADINHNVGTPKQKRKKKITLSGTRYEFIIQYSLHGLRVLDYYNENIQSLDVHFI